MLRVATSFRAAAISKDIVPRLACQQHFHHVSSLGTATTDLYSQLLEDINDDKKKRKRRSRKIIPQSDGDEPEQVAAIDQLKPPQKRKSKVSRKGSDKAPLDTSKEHLEGFTDSPSSSETQLAALKEIKSPRISLSLLKNPWQDVTRYLKTAYKASLGDSKRAHVVSQKLCDDVIERLEPTLEQHVGCDIIDINPGTCLWSKTLHARLKPRKHILIEPDEKVYRPFILPLLDAPDSKYSLIPKSGIVWAHLQTVLTKQHLPHQPQMSRSDPRMDEKNNTLLVIANLGYYPMKPYRGFDSVASLVLYQFLSATRTHSLFQRYGRVRFMVWTNDEEKRHLLPREVHMRRKAAIEAEIAFEELNEVASSTEHASAFQRDPKYDRTIGQSLVTKMRDMNMSIPQGRESVLIQNMSGEDIAEDTANIYGVSQVKLEELAAKARKFETGEIPIAVPSQTTGTKHSPEYQKYKREMSLIEFCRRRDQNIHEICETHNQMIDVEKDIALRIREGKDTSELESNLAERREEWLHEVSVLSDELQLRVYYLLDNRRAIDSDPPLLFYDRRPYEPLHVQADEFYPPKPMVLLDFHPAAAWKGVGDDHQDILEFILGTVFHLPSQSVKKALKGLWPGAYEWMVESCPSLTDPHRGGALDLDTFSVRTMSQEMIKEMVTAWTKWPFRPSKHEMISKMGGMGYDPETEKS